MDAWKELPGRREGRGTGKIPRSLKYLLVSAWFSQPGKCLNYGILPELWIIAVFSSIVAECFSPQGKKKKKNPKCMRVTVLVTGTDLAPRLCLRSVK